MGGRYSGHHMTIYGSILPGAIGLVHWAAKNKTLERRLKDG